MPAEVAERVLRLLNSDEVEILGPEREGLPRLMLRAHPALSAHIRVAQCFPFLVDDEASVVAKRSEFVKDHWTLPAQRGDVQSGQT
jgi:hypothetical protein